LVQLLEELLASPSLGHTGRDNFDSQEQPQGIHPGKALPTFDLLGSVIAHLMVHHHSRGHGL
jgi:hypothetical protein